MSLPARDDVDSEYRFDLTRIFETPADWEAAAEDLRERLAGLELLAAESLDAAADLRALLERTEDCYRRRGRLDLYASLYENVNTGDDRADDLRRRFDDLDAEFEPAVAAVTRRLRETDDTRLDALVAISSGTGGTPSTSASGPGASDPYCSFQYVLGATGALVVRNRLREGSLTPAEYRDFLRNTGQRKPVEQFEALGVDVTSAAPYERVAEAFDGYLDEFALE